MCNDHGSSNFEIYRTPDESIPPPPLPEPSMHNLAPTSYQPKDKPPLAYSPCVFLHTTFRQLPSQDLTFIILLRLPILLEKMFPQA
jgi:hypothetical protein